MNPGTFLVLMCGLIGAWVPSAPATEPADGQTLARFPALQSVNAMLFSPDGKTIATLRGEDTFWHKLDQPLTLQLWTVPEGRLLWTASESAFYLCAFSPDSTRLAGLATDGNLAFWNLADGTVTHHFPRQNGMVGAQFSPDGGRLVMTVSPYDMMTSSRGEIRLWETRTGGLVRTLKAQTNGIAALAVSPDGKLLAVASEKAGAGGIYDKINLLDLEMDSLRHSLPLPKNVWTIRSVIFSPDGQTLAAGAGHHDGTGEITLWDVASGRPTRTITDDHPRVAVPISMDPTLAFSPDGATLVSVGEHQSMILWDAATGKQQMAVGGSQPPPTGVFTVQFTETGLLSAKVNPLGQVEIQSWNCPAPAMAGGKHGDLSAPLAKLSAKLPELSVVEISIGGPDGQNSVMAEYLIAGAGKLMITAKSYDSAAAAKAGQDSDQRLIQAGGWNKTETIQGVAVFEHTNYGTMYFRIGPHTFNLSTIGGDAGAVQPWLKKAASALIADLAPPLKLEK